MSQIYCNLFVIARISSLKPKVKIELDQRAQGPFSRGEPNHLMIGLYSQASMFYELLHTANWSTPIRIQVSLNGRGRPSDKAMRASASAVVGHRFPSLSLEPTPTTGSYWTGTYWFRPKQAQFAAGFRIIDGAGQPVTGILGAVSTKKKLEQLELDFVALVQSL